MESTRTPKGLTSTPHYEIMIDTRDDRTVYEIWSEDFGQHELDITVHMPSRYRNMANVDPYLGYQTTNIQTPELAQAFAETFQIASKHFAEVAAAWETEQA